MSQRIKSGTATCDRCAQQTDSPTTESESEATLCPTCVEESAIVPELAAAARRVATFVRQVDGGRLERAVDAYYAAEDV